MQIKNAASKKIASTKAGDYSKEIIFQGNALLAFNYAGIKNNYPIS